jgi:hypothetical protein
MRWRFLAFLRCVDFVLDCLEGEPEQDDETTDEEE